MPPQRTANQWRAHRLPPRLISTGATHTSSPPTILHREPPVTAQRPKLLDQVREAIRMRHYSLRTEDTYIHWCRRKPSESQSIRVASSSLPIVIRYVIRSPPIC